MSSVKTADWVQFLLRASQEEGIPLSNVVDLDPSLPLLKEHFEAYDSWLESGFQGEMEYLSRGRDRRFNPKLLFPETQSVFCIAVPYPTFQAHGSEETVQYARYLWGKDYHETVQEKLERVLKKTKEKFPELEWKASVDTSAVLERSWAWLCGLGFIGKNTMLIHPKLGSYLYLGSAFLNLKSGNAPEPLRSYCGHCERCLKACPTQVILENRVLKANECVSYLTLETRKNLEIKESLKHGIGSWVSGCDRCQEVCPFNHKAVENEELKERETFPLDWESLLLEEQEAYKKRIQSSALSRVKPDQFQRNLAIVIQNAIREKRFPKKWADLLEKKYQNTENPIVKKEWKQALELLAHSETIHSNRNSFG